MNLSRCARPTIGTRSTYTVLGFVGYAAGTLFAAMLAMHWSMTLEERLIVLLAPPLAFLLVVAIARAIAGRELIVFYQAAIAATSTVAIAGALRGANVVRLVDTAVLGIGVMLTFGRLGCFAVACCHGRPARRGVRYGAAHVAAGFWKRWSGRTLFPIQLVESAASLGLVIGALALSALPGRAAVIYIDGYALLRFGLELHRGDPVRPFALGLSEAQWFSIAVVGAVALASPTLWTVTAAGVLVLGAIVLVARRRRRELLLPPHLRVLDEVCSAVLADPAHARRDTGLGLGVTCHYLDDGRIDWVLSSGHAMWSVETARQIADTLWRDSEVVAGRMPGVVHVIVPPEGGAR